MENRAEKILEIIIKEYVKTATPISSGLLVEKYKLDISSATVRNEMADLENNGYIVQPHTSAGRIPTEKAYAWFIGKMTESKLNKNEEIELSNSLKELNEINFKESAKILSNFSGLAVFWAFHRHNVYYTGVSNLLGQPEFVSVFAKAANEHQLSLIYDISAIIDRIDEVVNNVFDEMSYEPTILLGDKNPFGHFFGSIMTKYKLGQNIGLFGILGPVRMNYEKNLALVNFIKNKINN